MHNITRRGAMALLGGVPALAALPGLASAQGAKPVRIGILDDMNGVFSDSTGMGSVIAARMAAADAGGRAAGRPVEIIFADHQNKPDVAVGIARSWFDEGGVDAIADLGNSAAALAVADVARQKNKAVLISAGGSTLLTGAACTPNTVQWTYDTYATANTLAKAMLRAHRGNWFFITADYTFGQSLQDEATRTLLANGGTVAGSAKHPLNTMDFSSFLLAAQATNAQVIALANGGDDTGRAVKQAREFGMKQPIVGLSAMISDVMSVGQDTAQGLLLTESFYWDRNDGSRAFTKRWSPLNKGRYPTMMQAGVYGVVAHYLKAVTATGAAEDGAAVVAKMKAIPTDDPLFGKGIIRADGRKIHDMFVFQVKPPSASRHPGDFYDLEATIPGDQAFRPLSEGGCKLVKA